jgi:hypothetical protein
VDTERLTPERKLELVQGLLKASNVKLYAEKVGYDRSYLYELKREMEQSALRTWTDTNPGRPSKPPEPSEELCLELHEAKRSAVIWRLRAQAAEIVVEALQATGVVKKTTADRPIFWRH